MHVHHSSVEDQKRVTLTQMAKCPQAAESRGAVVPVCRSEYILSSRIIQDQYRCLLHCQPLGCSSMQASLNEVLQMLAKGSITAGFSIFGAPLLPPRFWTRMADPHSGARKFLVLCNEWSAPMTGPSANDKSIF